MELNERKKFITNLDSRSLLFAVPVHVSTPGTMWQSTVSGIRCMIGGKSCKTALQGQSSTETVSVEKEILTRLLTYLKKKKL